MGKRIKATVAALAIAVTAVGGFEGLRLSAYRDAVGKATICYGETLGVQMGDRSSQADCDAKLRARLAWFDRQLAGCIPGLPDMPAETHAALVSWAYNIGIGAACGSTLARRANAGDLIGACNELLRWNRAGGRVLPGLSNRRAAEREMCLEGLR